MMHPFVALSSEYESWVAKAHPRPERSLEIDRVARKLIQPSIMTRFDEVYAEIGVPQVVPLSSAVTAFHGFVTLLL